MISPTSNQAIAVAVAQLVEKHREEIDRQIRKFVRNSKILSVKSDIEPLAKSAKERLLIELEKLLLRKKGLQASEKNILHVLLAEICNDFEDLQCLQEHSSHLIVKYQYLILGILHKFINTNALREQDKEDALQMVNEKLLRKIAGDKLLQFRGETLFKHFFATVITNTLRDVLRSMRSRQKREIVSDLERQAKEITFSTDIEFQPDLEKHTSALTVILKLFPFSEKNKFEFSVKVMYCILFNAVMVRMHYPNCSNELLIELLSEFGKPYGDKNKGELFQLLSTFLTELENTQKKLNADAVRKWFIKCRNLVWRHLFTFTITAKQKKNLDVYFELVIHEYYKN